jgi:hypothetical protein
MIYILSLVILYTLVNNTTMAHTKTIQAPIVPLQQTGPTQQTGDDIILQNTIKALMASLKNYNRLSSNNPANDDSMHKAYATHIEFPIPEFDKLNDMDIKLKINYINHFNKLIQLINMFIENSIVINRFFEKFPTFIESAKLLKSNNDTFNKSFSKYYTSIDNYLKNIKNDSHTFELIQSFRNNYNQYLHAKNEIDLIVQFINSNISAISIPSKLLYNCLPSSYAFYVNQLHSDNNNYINSMINVVINFKNYNYKVFSLYELTQLTLKFNQMNSEYHNFMCLRKVESDSLVQLLELTNSMKLVHKQNTQNIQVLNFGNFQSVNTNPDDQNDQNDQNDLDDIDDIDDMDDHNANTDAHLDDLGWTIVKRK